MMVVGLVVNKLNKESDIASLLAVAHFYLAGIEFIRIIFGKIVRQTNINVVYL